jgi:hypothetical protein
MTLPSAALRLANSTRDGPEMEFMVRTIKTGSSIKSEEGLEAILQQRGTIIRK